MNFKNKLPLWKNQGSEPSEELKENGFYPGYKPPANIFNWFWSKVSGGINELQEALETLPAKDLGSNPNLDDVTETGYYRYINFWNEPDLLIVHNYPEKYVVQYRLTANSLERRYRSEGGTVYNNWASIASVDANAKALTIGDSTKLQTTDKSSIVSAINEVQKAISEVRHTVNKTALLIRVLSCDVPPTSQPGHYAAVRFDVQISYVKNSKVQTESPSFYYTVNKGDVRAIKLVYGNNDIDAPSSEYGFWLADMNTADNWYFKQTILEFDLDSVEAGDIYYATVNIY